MKPNKISYLLLSSTRVSGMGNGSGTYNLGQTLPGVTKIKLQHMSFYNTFYNVSATNNKSPNIISAGTMYPGVAIPVGIYTTPSFAAALQAVLNSQGSGLTFTTTYNKLTQTISISAGSAFQLVWAAGSCYVQAGFNLSTTLSATSLTGPNVANLGRPTHLLFNITNLPSNYICAGINYDGTSFVVPINEASEALMSYNINSRYKQSIIFGYPTAVDCFDIMLSTISSETNTPSNQVTLDDWMVILEVESIEGIPYQTKFS